MAAVPLDYLPHAPLKSPQRLWRLLGAGGATVLLVLVVQILSTYSTDTMIDPITGSMRHQTVWRFGITLGATTDISALEARLNRCGIQWTRSWQLLTSRETSLFGATGIACASAPPIYQLRPVLKDFTDTSTDGELQDFVRVMQTGTDAARNAAIDAAGDKALRALSN